MSLAFPSLLNSCVLRRSLADPPPHSLRFCFFREEEDEEVEEAEEAAASDEE